MEIEQQRGQHAMSLDETENDAEIARLLHEDYTSQSYAYKRSTPSSPVLAKKFKVDDTRDLVKNSSLNKASDTGTQIDEDGEMAFLLQIEEIVLSENQINGKTVQATDAQLEKTRAAITDALQSTEQTDIMTRIFGMFTAVRTRYTDCQTKNQVLIDQMQKLSIQFYPLLISFATGGQHGISKAAVPGLAVGLIANVLQGRMELTEARQILSSLLQLWNDSSIWYEFFEQLVYIFVAMTMPTFTQLAMGKLMGSISSSK